MRVIVEAAIYLTGAHSGQLFLTNVETQGLELRAIRGPSDSRARCVRQPGADRIAAQAAKTGKPLIAERDGGGTTKIPRMVAPLRAQRRVVGVLGVDAKPNHLFNDNDRYLMGILADFAAVAVVNSQLVEDLRGEVVTLSNQSSVLPGGDGRNQSVRHLGESVTEAERLSHELRNLAAAAQVLAAKLQVVNDGD
jgi:GAF domain-containing protein